MGYSIEVSFNVLKHGNVTEIKDEVENLATSCGCKMFYDDYEFENNHRKQCVITVGFDNENICYLIVFLKNIRSKKYLYIENIYDDITRQILYASRYYITQKMDKGYSRLYKEERRKRSYSEDDTMILDVINKNSN
jgi:hypothetical protein